MPCWIPRLSGAIAATLLSLAAAAAEAPEVALRFATINTAATSTFKLGLVPWAETLARESDGRLKVELGTLNQLGKPAELLPKLERGEIDMAQVVQGYFPGRFPRSEVIELPLMHASAVSGSAALWQMLEEGLLAEEYKNLKVLALFVLPPYGIYLAEHKVESPRDLRGVSVRAPSQVMGAAFDRLGMVPLGLPFNISGDYIAQGEIEAVSLTWDTLTSTPAPGNTFLIDHVKHGLDLRFAAPAQAMLMNKARFDALPEEFKALIDKHSGREFSRRLARLRDQADAEAKARFMAEPGKQVVELTPEQRSEVAQRVEPTVAQWVADMQAKGIDGAALVARARALIAANEKR